MRAGLIAWLLLIAPGASALGSDAPPCGAPNFVLILLDNVGQDWFGCYGSLEGQTPAIDRLARHGVSFRHYYVMPLCSTSRHVLLTGRYPFRTGWTVHHDASIYGGGYFDWNREICFARLLRRAGYATAIAGKWQMNNLFEQPEAPERHGFQEHCLFPDGPRGHPAHGRRYWDPYVICNGQRMDAGGRFGPDVFTDFLIDFIARHHDRPFLAFYSMSLVHLPVVETPLNRGQKLEAREQFAGMVRYADHCVGRLVEALERLGVRRRTVVIVTSDNGTPAIMGGRVAGGRYQASADTMVEGDMKEGEIAVPLVANCPGLIPPGRTSDALIDCSDVFPTLMELAGISVPSRLTLDGHSFAAVLRGAADEEAPRQWIFSQYGRHRVVRDRRFKLHSDGRFYDLRGDPLERENLAKAADREASAARERLQGVLHSLPADAPLWFVPRSISARRMGLGRSAQREEDAKRAPRLPELPPK